MSLHIDAKGREHATAASAAQADSTYNIEKHAKLQTAASAVTAIAATAAAINTAETVRLTRMQTQIVADKADYDRIVSHLDGEPDESKWETIRPYIENKIYEAIHSDALNEIKASWNRYLIKNGLKEKFTHLVSERRKLERLGRELIAIRGRKPYPTVLLKNLKTSGGESADQVWRILLCVFFWPLSIPAGALMLIYNYPPKIKKLLEKKELEVKETVNGYKPLLESLNVERYISQNKSLISKMAEYNDIVWNYVALWQNEYPPRCRMKRNDQLFSDEIEFIVFSAYDDFKADPVAVMLTT